MAEVGSIIVLLAARTEALEKALDTANKKIDAFKGNVEKTSRSFGSLGDRAAGVFSLIGVKTFGAAAAVMALDRALGAVNERLKDQEFLSQGALQQMKTLGDDTMKSIPWIGKMWSMFTFSVDQLTGYAEKASLEMEKMQANSITAAANATKMADALEGVGQVTKFTAEQMAAFGREVDANEKAINDMITSTQRQLDVANFGEQFVSLVDAMNMGATDNQLAELNSIYEKLNALEREVQLRKEIEASMARAASASAQALSEAQAVVETMQQQAKAIFDATRSPAEAAMIELEKMQKLLAGGFLDGESFRRAVEDLHEGLLPDPERFGATQATKLTAVSGMSASLNRKQKVEDPQLQVVIAKLDGILKKPGGAVAQ